MVIHNYWYWTAQLSTAYLCHYSLYLHKNFESTAGDNAVKSEVLSEFPQCVLPLPCNVCISVTSEHHQSD